MYLNCKTYFSFKYGTFSTEELVQTAVDKGVTTLALTNINSTWDNWEFVKLCRQQGVKPVLGAEIRNGDEVCCILLAANQRGLTWIHEFISAYPMNEQPYPAAADGIAYFEKETDGFVVFPTGKKKVEELKSNERIGIRPNELSSLFGIDMGKWGDRLVVCHPVTVQDKKRYELHRILRAIDHNVVGSKLMPSMVCSPEETFISPAALLERFKLYPSIVMNTYRLMDQCTVELDFSTDKTKKNFSGDQEDDKQLLAKLTAKGIPARYGRATKTIQERAKKELSIINAQGFNAYFLITWDYCRYAASQGYFYVGRGSGANSMIAYALRITDVDPIELNLYFERFLNPHRTSPPDFDIDFSYTDRDDVVDYIFKRYGRKHVALLGSYPTFKHDAVIREIGKVFGLPDEEIKSLQRSGVATDPMSKLVLQYGKLLYGFPSHPSLHPCGVLITERPMLEYAAVFMPPKGLPTVMMDMFVAEDIGINKFDVLSQRGLGHIKESLRLIKQNRGIDIDIHAVEAFKNDQAVAARIRQADTVGCFYIESPAMRQLLSKLRCDDYPTLVAASSIIRPGVAESGMMREYIQRYHEPGKVKYLHPLFEEHLSETFGVMVFQEDVIKIAHYYAGLDLGKADILRRAMSGKYRSNNQFQQIKREFFASAKEQGHPEVLSAEIWRQMESFAGYSFNKAHSASFAVESYQSLFLKTFYPQEFMVAVINNFGGFYSTALYFIELLKTGATILGPCVNRSERLTNIQGQDVWTGFVHIKRLQSTFIETLLEERRRGGSFLHIQDFIERTGVGLEQLNILISSGAFRFTGKSRKTLLWEANFLQRKTQVVGGGVSTLFQEKPLAFQLPELIDDPLDNLYDELETMGFTLGSPFALAEEGVGSVVMAADLPHYAGKSVSVLVYFINRKQVPVKSGGEMFFVTSLDANLQWIYTVHFPDVARRYPMHNGGFFKITGRVTSEFGVYSIEATKVESVGHKKKKYAGL